MTENTKNEWICKRFQQAYDKQEDELILYSDLLKEGVTILDVAESVDTWSAARMHTVCEAHGLLQKNEAERVLEMVCVLLQSYHNNTKNFAVRNGEITCISKEKARAVADLMEDLHLNPVWLYQNEKYKGTKKYVTICPNSELNGFDRDWNSAIIKEMVKKNCYLNFAAHSDLRVLCINEEDCIPKERDWSEMSYVVPARWLREFCRETLGIDDLDDFLKETYTSDESEEIFVAALRDRQVVMVDFQNIQEV